MLSACGTSRSAVLNNPTAPPASLLWSEFGKKWVVGEHANERTQRFNLRLELPLRCCAHRIHMCGSRYSYRLVEGQILNDNETESESREQSEDSDAERNSKLNSSH